MDWIKQHWLALLGVLALGKPLWSGLVWLVERGGDIDFIVSRLDEPGWVGEVAQWVLHPPEWIVWLLLPIGMALIWWDLRKAQRAPAPSTATEASPLDSEQVVAAAHPSEEKKADPAALSVLMMDMTLDDKYPAYGAS